MPKQIKNLFREQEKHKRRGLLGSLTGVWMRGQLTQMVKLNQGLISMSLGR